MKIGSQSSRKTWPILKSEEETLDAILAGASISRFGDGELKICNGGDCISQVYVKKLAEEMREILQNNNKRCIVGLPNYVESPKKWFWDKVCTRPKYMDMLNYNTQYYSQFITRPDSAPWIDNKPFWDKFESLWKGKDVILVAGSERSLTKKKGLDSANYVLHVQAQYRDTYDIIDDLETEVLESGIKTVILCAGATATVLADRLSRRGRHALDLGHIGMFWSKRNVTEH